MILLCRLNFIKLVAEPLKSAVYESLWILLLKIEECVTYFHEETCA